MTEREFQKSVLELAKFFSWKVAHFDASVRIVGKERRHVGDRGAAGFPDLVLVREDRLIFAELKLDTTYPTANQREWLDLLTSCARNRPVQDEYFAPFEVYLWRPRDRGEIEVVLR